MRIAFSRIQSAKWKFTPDFTPYFTPYLTFLAEVKPPASRGLENHNPRSRDTVKNLRVSPLQLRTDRQTYRLLGLVLDIVRF